MPARKKPGPLFIRDRCSVMKKHRRLVVLSCVCVLLVACLAYRYIHPKRWIVEGVAASSQPMWNDARLTPAALLSGTRSLSVYRTVLFNHDRDKPVGVLTGYRHVQRINHHEVVVTIELDQSQARLWRDIRSGLVTGLSIAFIPQESHPDVDQYGNDVLVVTRCVISEISIVTVPAGPACRILSTRVE